ncbi:rhodanese-like domain-containing protein [Candidatus Saccharibacteria bacterium]|nr:rhodanese-like domain-containing protein [Candidatus Saccharibacteria bacterium]
MSRRRKPKKHMQPEEDMQTMSRVIIDVREPFEYKMGHVEGAINLPPARIMSGATELEDIPKDAELIVYCRSGARSSASIHYLQQMGFTNVTNGINQGHVERMLA